MQTLDNSILDGISITANKRDNAPDYKKHLNKYIKVNYLNNVNDPFDIDYFWDRAQTVFAGKQKQQQGSCLMEALQKQPRTRANRFRKESRFSHIKILISEQKILDDHYLDKGWQKKTLQQACEDRHAEDLLQFVSSDSSISYDIIASEQLAEDEMGFVFGHAVYIPQKDEKPVYCVSIKQNNNEDTWQNAGYIYAQQRLSLINGHSFLNTIKVTNWPFASLVSLLLLYDEDSAELEVPVAVPEKSLSIQSTSTPYVYSLSDGEQELLLKIEKSADNNPATDSDTINHTTSVFTDAQDDLLQHQSETWYGGVADLLLPHLDVVAIALPRAEYFSKAGLDKWQIFGHQLEANNTKESQSYLQVDNKDRVVICDKEHQYCPVNEPACFALDGKEYQLTSVSDALQNDYSGFLMLPFKRSLLMKSTALILGRDPLAEMSLNWFPQDNLNLSRKHLALNLQDNQLEVSLLSTSQNCFHLDSSLSLINKLSAGNNTQKTIVLPHEYLLLGNYLLQFLL